ncbi:NKIRAS1 [Bugula neritina]|uniref:NKIRAS1 n=1 Tax=Bugula neritina TaxID=10212 RepID=A0A7J7J9R2_BUGNE|nr:NKIRAS1 [Bugula neritina]
MPSKVHKIIILGADGTGKTSIIEQAIYGNHVAGTKMVPTVEDTYTANIFTERNCLEQLRLFDTAGLDCQTPVVPKHYYSFADAYILVFDITRNKSDLEHSSRQIEFDTVKNWAAREKVHFREVSVTNKKSLMDAFSFLVSKLLPQRSIKSRFKKDSAQATFSVSGLATDV